MKRDRAGRLWPSRPIEHLVFWPIIAVGAVFALYFANWLSSLVPKNSGGWMISTFGEIGVFFVYALIFVVGVFIFRWAGRLR